MDTLKHRLRKTGP